MRLIKYIGHKIKSEIRFTYAVIFCIILVSTHLLWRIIIDTGLENKEYMTRLHNGHDVGVLAKIKDNAWEFVTGERPDRTNTDIRHIAIFGHELSEAFYPLCKATARTVTPLCNLFKDGFENREHDENGEKRYLIYHNSHKDSRFEVVWGCTSIKQILMFLLIMMTTYGKLKHRLIYFLISIPVIMFINSLRISGIVCLSTGNMGNFQLWHDGVFWSIYYLTLFMLWLLWIEYTTRRIYRDEKK